jgi:hypothetical protein
MKTIIFWPIRGQLGLIIRGLNIGSELPDCSHQNCRQILRQNAGLTFLLAQSLNFAFFGLLGVN